MDSPAIPDDLLVEIFLRIPSPAGLLRASAACISFRRLITDRSFLRRYRRLHTPPFLGFLDYDRVFHPAEPPHPSASAASAVALAADFSFDFLPGLACDYLVEDVRGGRVLLSKCHFDDRCLVVCDPLHRRYLTLPPISDALANSVETMLELWPERWRNTFLAPPGNDNDEAAAAEGTSFRVIWMAQCGYKKMFTFVFSSDTGQWRVVPSQSWNDLCVGSLGPTGISIFNHCQYAYGRFYWMMKWKDGMKMLVFDTATLEFSILEPPPEAKGGRIPNMTMVETGQGVTGLFMLACGTSTLRYSIRRYNGGSASEWQSEKTMSLASRYSLISSLESNLFLYDDGSSSLDPGFFTLDIETLQLEKVCGVDIYHPHAYSNFPPSLSSPTI
ncbi:hypothetical protein ACQJBY_035216 [Aegilops geniculata]